MEDWWVGKPAKLALSCWLCEVKGIWVQKFVHLVRRRTVTVYRCECGWSHRSKPRPTDDEHDFLDYAKWGRGVAATVPARPVCLWCGHPLTGRQRKFCCDAHKMAFHRQSG